MECLGRIWGVLCLLIFPMFFLTGSIFASDDISDLKTQIKSMEQIIQSLKGRVEELEAKQTAQSQEVAKIPEIKNSVEQLKDKPAAGNLFEGARLGGHLMMYLYDQTDGKRNNNKQGTNISAGVSRVYLNFGKDLSDNTSITLQEEITVSASATPSLGSNITRSSSASVSTSFSQAFIKTILPNDLELKAGLFTPLFCEEYGAQTFWDEQYHQHKGLIMLEAWHDTGIELYKNLEFKHFSMPTYLYLLNGEGQFVDNNDGKTVLIHITPQVSNLKLLGSFGIGKWDDGDAYKNYCYALGSEYKYNKFTLRSEYMFKKYFNKPLSDKSLVDTEYLGYYMKALYRFNPKWRAVIDYSDVELPYTSEKVIRHDTYKVSTFGLNYFITESSIIMAGISFIDADRSNDTESQSYYRSTLGWRTTF